MFELNAKEVGDEAAGPCAGDGKRNGYKGDEKNGANVVKCPRVLVPCPMKEGGEDFIEPFGMLH